MLVEATVNKDGRTTYKSAVRYAYNERIWFGTYADREEAARVAQHFIDTGERDTRNALKPGPRPGLKPRKKRIDTRGPRNRGKRSTAVNVASRPSTPDKAERLETLKRLYRASY